MPVATIMQSGDRLSELENADGFKLYSPPDWTIGVKQDSTSPTSRSSLFSLNNFDSCASSPSENLLHERA